ncbi:MAG: MFS transporter [Promethearchaeota archaeon]
MNNSNSDLHSPSSHSNTKVTPIRAQTWFVITILGIAGQLAWAVENSWFNVFVYDEITENPAPIAWMVAVSAVTATLTTILIGALSDRTQSRMGKRKPYILFGYILWGIITALFPLVEMIQKLSVAVFMVILMDAIMTFFGSTANDAAFNAWIADVSDHSNRGRVQGILMMTALVANLIAIGASGFIIEAFGYPVFFYVLGGFVTIAGMIAGLQVKEPPQNYPNFSSSAPEEVLNTESTEKLPKKSLWHDILFAFRPSTIRNNPILYILLALMALINIGGQVSAPYLFVYLENYLEFTKGEVGIIGGVVILVAAIVSIIYGMNSHKFPRHWVLLTAILLNGIFSILLGFIQNMVPVMVIYTCILSIQMINSIALESWIQDLLPPDDRGKFQGVRMVAFVAIPMVIGPIIGNSVIKSYGIPSETEVSGFLPTPEIFLVGGLMSLLALIPALFIVRKNK